MFEKLEELAKNNKKISDFHIRSGSPLGYRQTGEIYKVKEVIVKAQDVQDLISTNCNEIESKRFKDTHELYEVNKEYSQGNCIEQTTNSILVKCNTFELPVSAIWQKGV